MVWLQGLEQLSSHQFRDERLCKLRYDAKGVVCCIQCRPQNQHGANLNRSEEHTSELQSLMRISYAVFCLKKKINDMYPDTANSHIELNKTSIHKHSIESIHVINNQQQQIKKKI